VTPLDESRDEAPAWLRALSWAALALALHQVYVFLSLTLSSRDYDLWLYFSSDTLQYGLLYKDLFDLGFHFGGWNISHAPEYVQMAVALLARAISPTLVAGHVLESLLQPVLLALSLNLLMRKALGRKTALAPVAVAAILYLISRNFGLDFIAVIWSNRHGFTAILTALALWLFLEPQRSRAASTALVATVTAGVASDLLFLVWFAAPALAAAGMSWRPRQRWPYQRGAALVVLGIGLGLMVFRFATPMMTVGEKVEVDPSRAVPALWRMVDDARAQNPQQFLFNFLLVAGFLVALVLARRAQTEAARLAAIFAVLLPLISAVSVAATAAPFRERGYTRYLLAPEIGALLVIAYALSRFRGKLGEGILAAAVWGLLLVDFRSLPPGVTPIHRYESPLVRCIDDAAAKHGLQFGVADYWLAKYVTALSSRDLSVVAVTNRLDPYVKFSNIEWFLGGVGAQRHDRPIYTFAITGASSATEPGIAPQALARLGPPVAVESCFAFRIVVLPAGGDARLRAQFLENPRIRRYYADRGLPLPGVEAK
jgi:hypothetical protein